jgi:ABC-type transporter Mla subunit MlaD
VKDQSTALLGKLFYASTKLDFAYLESIQNGGKTSFTGEQYDEINDILVEVEEFLNS